MYVYIMSNRSGTLYVGVTNDILRRVREHRASAPGRFTTRYRLDRLVYVEHTESIRGALVREKQIKGWTRRKKLALIATLNPGWTDLATCWFDDEASPVPDPPEPDPSLRSG
jgi:putative endonuclease